MATNSPESPAEDQNGHKIGPDGKLVFDERCRGCDAPLTAVQIQKVRKELDGLEADFRKQLTTERPGTGFYLIAESELQAILYLRTLEKGRDAGRTALALAWSMLLGGEKVSDKAEEIFKKGIDSLTIQ